MDKIVNYRLMLTISHCMLDMFSLTPSVYLSSFDFLKDMLILKKFKKIKSNFLKRESAQVNY